MPRRRKRRSSGYAFQRERKDGTLVWYVGYRVNGKKVRHVTECTEPPRENGKPPKEVEDVLRECMNELDDGSWTHPTTSLTLQDLLDLVGAAWRALGRKSRLKTPTGRDVSTVKHLREAFGHVTDVRTITATRLARYMTDRLDAGAQPSTVRNELNLFQRAMRLAHRQGELARVPAFPTIKPTTVRDGYFAPEDVAAVLAELPDHLRAVVTFAYLTGWRLGEILSLTWARVDVVGQMIRLEGHRTKAGKPRVFPYRKFPALQALIAQQRDYTSACERRHGRIIAHVFHREGEPVRPFNKTWRRAVDRAAHEERNGMRLVVRPNLVGRLIHDFRRTCARNMRRRGLSESDIMDLCGWETRAMFQRYCIVDEDALAESVARFAEGVPASLADPRRTRGAVGA